MSTFDPSAFLNATITEANSTVTTPCPEGEFFAIIDGEPKINQWQSRDGSKSGLRLDLTWSTDDDAACSVTGRKPTKIRQGIMLDLTENGGLDMGRGKNVSLGRLREATGLNVPGQPFSFSMLQGKAAKVSVGHRIVEDRIYDEVKGVAKLA
jgi:hypothetical protein